MTRVQLLVEIKEMLQTDAVLTEDMLLRDVEGWDSLASISIVALYDRLFGMLLSNQQVSSCRTLGDLLKLAGENVNGR